VTDSARAELAVLEVAHAAVHHVAGCRGGAGHVVAALDERDVDALQGEVAEGRDAVDAAADDEHTACGRSLRAWMFERFVACDVVMSLPFFTAGDT
jgi:hypothetical protein